MRVLMLLSTSSVTGPAELCLSDAKALRGAGHDVLFGLDTRRPGTYAEAIRAAGFEAMEELALCRQAAPLEVARDVVRLRRRLQHADLVHCRFSHEHALALMASQAVSRRPALVRTLEIASALRPGLVRGATLRACDAVIVPCERYSLTVKSLHGLPPERVHVVPGRVDPARFSPGDGGRLRSELGIAAGEVLFGIVSRIKEERRHEEILRAFAVVARERPQVRLAVIGRGEHEPEIRALVQSLGLEGRVVFAGYRTGEALVEAYRALDVKIWLAEGNDGTCRAVLEAMACGKAVIVGDGGALPEIVCDGEDGRVVADEQGLVEALRQLTGPLVRERMGKAALERARSFTSERRFKALWYCYQQAASTRAPGTPKPA